MSKYGYAGPERYRPLSPWAYFGYSLLFAIPVVGFIFLIVFSFSTANYNRRSYARSYFCALLVALIVMAVVLIIAAATGSMQELTDSLQRMY